MHNDTLALNLIAHNLQDRLSTINLSLLSTAVEDLVGGKSLMSNINLEEKTLKEFRNNNKDLCRTRSLFISLLINENPNGVTGPTDIEKTLTISVSFKGSVRKFRAKSFNDTDIANFHKYVRFGDFREKSIIVDELNTLVFDFIKSKIDLIEKLAV